MYQLTDCQEKAANAFAGFLLDPEQREFLLTGPAGSGKSFLVNHLIQEAPKIVEMASMLDDTAPTEIWDISLVATTHKAAAVMDGFAGRPVHGTIHSYLGLGLKWDNTTREKVLKINTRNGQFNYAFGNSGEPGIHLLVVDEASMVNRQLYGFVQQWLEKSPASKILWIGDEYQLPPVKEDKCVIFERGLPHAALQEVVRQEKNTDLAKVVRLFRNGVERPDRLLESLPQLQDQSVIWYDTENEDDLEAWWSALLSAFPNAGTLPNARILAWSNDRVDAYAKWLRKEWGLAETPQPGEIVTSNEAIVNGDGRLLVPGNCEVQIHGVESDKRHHVDGYVYDVETVDRRDHNNHSYRGHIFVPLDLSDKNKAVAILARKKKWDEVKEIKCTWGDLRFPQSITVHKSQGSTYEESFVDVSNINRCQRLEDYRRLLYVAASRSSKRLHLLGTPK